jgi:hypothetical protein
MYIYQDTLRLMHVDGSLGSRQRKKRESVRETVLTHIQQKNKIFAFSDVSMLGQLDHDLARERESKAELERGRVMAEQNLEKMKQELERYAHLHACMCLNIHAYTFDQNHVACCRMMT